MGWKWFKKKKEEVAPVQYCCECGGKMMRQTTLDEFMDILSKEQKRLPIELETLKWWRQLDWVVILAKGEE